MMDTSGARIILYNSQICQDLFESEIQKCVRDGEAAIDVGMLYHQMKTKGVTIVVSTKDGTSHEIEDQHVLAWIKRRVLVHSR
mgnify:CR=1 FL=1